MTEPTDQVVYEAARKPAFLRGHDEQSGTDPFGDGEIAHFGRLSSTGRGTRVRVVGRGRAYFVRATVMRRRSCAIRNLRPRKIIL
jgi:hypothetical protein